MKLDDLVKELKIVKSYTSSFYVKNDSTSIYYNNWNQIKEDIRLVINKRGDQVSQRWSTVEVLNTLLVGMNDVLEAGTVSTTDLNNYKEVIAISNIFIKRYDLEHDTINNLLQKKRILPISENQMARTEDSEKLVTTFTKIKKAF